MSNRGHIDSDAEVAPYLEKVNGLDRGKVIELVRNRMRVGRTIDNDIVLASEAVSRCHACLLRVGNEWYIQDNESKNGVVLNGIVVKDRQLQHGDVIQLGDQVFRFHNPGMALAASPAPRRAPPPAYPLPEIYTGSDFDQEKSHLAVYSVVTVVLLALGYLMLPAANPSPRLKAKRAGSELASRPSRSEGPRSVTASVTPAAPARVMKPVVPPPPKERALTSQEVTKMDEKKELAVYLREGIQFLQRGDFASAASAFQIAIVIDPTNATAMKGIKAAEYKINDISSVTLDSLPEKARPSRKLSRAERKEARAENKRRVAELMGKAKEALTRKSYSEAIELGEQIRAIEIDGETAYLNEAKQIIDKAREGRRDEFEPFLAQANEKYAEGDYTASRDLCEEMLKRDPAYKGAKECVMKARQKLASQGASAEKIE